jgi:hypothetical protein
MAVGVEEVNGFEDGVIGHADHSRCLLACKRALAASSSSTAVHFESQDAAPTLAYWYRAPWQVQSGNSKNASTFPLASI